MKKFVKILSAVLLLIVFALGAVACSNPDDKTGQKGLKYKKDSKTGLYTLYSYEDDGETEILDLSNVKDADGNDIVFGKISSGTFAGNDTLVEVIVPTTVTEISAGAFKNMNKLERLTLPFVGKNANSDAFYGETASSADKATDIERTFVYIFGTEEYEYGAPVTVNYGGGTGNYYIPAYLQKVTINSLESYSIPMYAFSGVSLIREVVLGDKIDAIGDNAFSACHDLLTVNIPASVLKIYKEAFKNSENFATATGFDKGRYDNMVTLMASNNYTDNDTSNDYIIQDDIFVGTKLEEAFK